MDLGAYSNIELLKELVDKNNIEVPRLRGYRLMKYENPIDYKEMFNKYCGRDDVLYIHARVGGANWNYYDCDNLVKSKDWFLDKIDDSYDCTYCDIYAKLKIKE